MNDKKKIGFEILENADIEKIREMRLNCDLLDEKTKERMFRNTMRKYEKAKRGIIMNKDRYNAEIPAENNDETTIEDVEVYNKQNIKQIAKIIANVAAVACLITGTVFLIKQSNFSDDKKVPSNPLTTISTDTANTGTDSKNTVTTMVDMTQTSGSDNTNTMTVSNDKNTALNSQTSIKGSDKKNNGTKPAQTTIVESSGNKRNANDYIMNDNIDNARIRVFEEIKKPDCSMIYDINYSYADLNNDKVPELFVSGMDHVAPTTNIYAYNGYNYELKTTIGGKIVVYLNEKAIIASTSEGAFRIQEINWDDNLIFYNGDVYLKYMDGYVHYDVECTKEEFDRFANKYNNATAVNFVYHEFREDLPGYIENARERAVNKFINKNMSSEPCQYAYFDMNNDSIPELYITGDSNLPNKETGVTELNPANAIYAFNGSEYEPILEDREIVISLEDRIIQKMNLAFDQWVTWDNNFNFTELDSIDVDWRTEIYKHNGVECSEDEYINVYKKYENCQQSKFIYYD